MKKKYQKPEMLVAETGAQQLFAASFKASKATSADEVGSNIQKTGFNDIWGN